MKKAIIILAVLAFAAIAFIVPGSDADTTEYKMMSTNHNGSTTEHGSFYEGSYSDNYYLGNGSQGEYLYYISGNNPGYVLETGVCIDYTYSTSSNPTKYIGNRFTSFGETPYILYPENGTYTAYTGSSMAIVKGIASNRTGQTDYTAIVSQLSNGYVAVSMFAGTTLSWTMASDATASGTQAIYYKSVKCGDNYAIVEFETGIYYFDSSGSRGLSIGWGTSYTYHWDSVDMDANSLAYAVGSNNYLNLHTYNRLTDTITDLSGSTYSTGGYVSDMLYSSSMNYIIFLTIQSGNYCPKYYDIDAGHSSLFGTGIYALPGSLYYSTYFAQDFPNYRYAVGMIAPNGDLRIAEFTSTVSSIYRIDTITNLGTVDRVFGSVNGYTVFYATHEPAASYTVSIVSNDSSYGSIQPSILYSVPANTEIQISSNVLTIGSVTVTAIPATATAQYTHAFSSWSVSSGATVTGDMTITATFSQTLRTYTITWSIDGTTSTETYSYGATPTHAAPTKPGYSFTGWNPSIVPVTGNATYTATWGEGIHAYWSNNLQNAVITTGYVFDTSSNTSQHTMVLYLDSYGGISSATHQAIWIATAYKLVLSFGYANHSLQASATFYNGTSIIVTYSNVGVGDWPSFIVTADLSAGTVIVSGVKFDTDGAGTSFLNWETFTTKIICDYSAVPGASGAVGTTTKKIEHYGPTSALFSVLDTRVFFDSYGLVMTNPEINLDQAFPSYVSARLSFYGFAVYGSSFTVNGQTYAVNNGQVTVTYATKSDGTHVLPSELPSATPKTKTMILSNIYLSWDNLTHHLTITFSDDRFSIDLGTYSAKSVSFDGSWWFTTELWSAESSTVKQLGGWKTLPDLTSNQFVLLFLGCLLILGTAAYVAARQSSGLVDIIIITLAAVVSMLILKM